MIRVGVNGYGVIGRRVAYAVSKQQDMQLVGIAKQGSDYKASLAARKGFDIYSSGDPKDFKDGKLKVSGTLSDLLSKVDIIVDCTPEGIGEDNKKLYEKAGVKAIWQGGEEHSISGLSFNAYANYASAIGARYARVVSCNTTGLLRTLYPLHKEFGIKNVDAFLVRRAADPSEVKKGPINSVDIAKMPSHHGDDVLTVLPGISINTIAIKVPTTLMHLHHVNVELNREVTKTEVLALFAKYRRIALFSMDDGVTSTAHVMDIAKELGRGSGDMYEVAVWREMKIKGNQLQYFQAVHQESDVVPENVDAIRAMCNGEKDAQKSIDLTDKNLNIGV